MVVALQIDWVFWVTQQQRHVTTEPMTQVWLKC